MEFTSDAQLLTAEAKSYNVQGNAGTSHKIRLNVNGEIFACSSSAEQVEAFKQHEGKQGSATFKLVSPKESLKLRLVSFEVEE